MGNWWTSLAHSFEFISKQKLPSHLLIRLLSTHFPPFNLNHHLSAYNCVVALTHGLILAWFLLTSSSNAPTLVLTILRIDNGSEKGLLVFVLKVQGNSYRTTSPLHVWVLIWFIQTVFSGNVAKMLPKCCKILSLLSISKKTLEWRQHTGELKRPVMCCRMYKVVETQSDPEYNPQSPINPTNTKKEQILTRHCPPFWTPQDPPRRFD